jgi:hypothetical protein
MSSDRNTAVTARPTPSDPNRAGSLPASRSGSVVAVPASRHLLRAVALVLQGMGLCGAIGLVSGGLAAAVAGIGTTLALPGMGLIVNGSLVLGLAGAGAGGLVGGGTGAFIGLIWAILGPAGPREATPD